MTKHIPKSKLLRFPLTFGGLLLLGSLAFTYREYFMQDIEEKRDNLYKENLDGRRLIEEYKRNQ